MAIGGAFLYLWDRTAAPAPAMAAESRRQGALMLLCLAVSLAFQIGYTGLIENLAVGASIVVLMTSAVYQVRSFRTDPYQDTGQNSVTNWRNVAATLSRLLRPGDVVLTSDFINRATLTFTQPLPHEVIVLPELERTGPPPTGRLVFLEPAGLRSGRDELVSRLQAQGYNKPDEHPVLAPDGVGVANDWRILVFSRP